MKTNTDTVQAVGLNTHLRTAIIYKATHPSVDGIYIGCRLDSLDGYPTSSNCFDEAIEATAVNPTLEPIDTLVVNWTVEKDRQIPYQREREVYDLLREMGALLLNSQRPTGFCPYVTDRHRELLSKTHTGKTISTEHRETLSKKLTGKAKAPNHALKISTSSNRKVISMLDGRVSSHARKTHWNKKNPDYIGTWVEL